MHVGDRVRIKRRTGRHQPSHYGIITEIVWMQALEDPRAQHEYARVLMYDGGASLWRVDDLEPVP